MRFSFILLLAFITTKSFAGPAPIEVKDFLQTSKPASCANIFLGECDNGYCYGEPEAFFFGVKGPVLNNPQAHSFEDYSSDNQVFQTQYAISEDTSVSTLTMSLYREAWAPTFPDNGGRNLGVTKFEYTITKRVADGKIIFAKEVEFIKKRNVFGALKKEWKQNSPAQICHD